MFRNAGECKNDPFPKCIRINVSGNRTAMMIARIYPPCQRLHLFYGSTTRLEALSARNLTFDKRVRDGLDIIGTDSSQKHAQEIVSITFFERGCITLLY